jgi:hypothetical protein
MTNKLAIVLGAHRSGTSMVTAGLESLGAYLGNKSTYVSTENPKGFFEDQDVVNFNDRLLGFLGGRWDNPLFDGRQSLANKSADQLDRWLDEAKEMFSTNYSGHELVAVKDPRICQLLPFWLKVFSQCGYSKKNIFYIHICRHPIEVAQSQHKRKQQNPDFYFLGKSLMETVSLWFSLSYQSLRDSNTDQSIFLSYPELLDDPRGQLERIASFLGVEGGSEAVKEYCQNFVEQGLRRNIVSSSDEELLEQEFPEALMFYRVQLELALKDSISNAEAQKALKLWKLHSVQKHFMKPIIPLFSEAVSQRWTLSQQLAEVRKKLNQSIAENRESLAALDDVKRIRQKIQSDLQAVISERDKINAELTEVNLSQGALQNELATVTLHRDQISAELDEVKSNIEKLQIELARITLDRDQRNSKLNEALSDKERLRVELETVYQKQEQSRLRLEAELDDVTKSRQKIQSDLQAVISQRDQISTELSEVKLSQVALQDELAAVTLSRDQVSVKLNEVKLNIEKLKIELARVTSDRDQRNIELNEALSDKERLRVELETACQIQAQSRLEAEGTIVAMKRTFSWRITAPLRMVRRLQKKLMCHFGSLFNKP